MIGKQFKRDSFRQVLNYVAGKEQAQLIGGNMAGQSVAELVAEFRRSQELNSKIRQPVAHIALSAAHADHLTSDDWQEIAHDYLERMGYDESQYVVFQHRDRAHDHVHLVVSRIRLSTGKVVSDSWNYPRSEAVLRDLEQEYGLTATPSSWEVEWRSPHRIELERRGQSNELSGRQWLQWVIDRCAKTAQTLPELIEQLQSLEVQVKLLELPHQQLGISYQAKGIAMSGTQLGRGYTVNGLQKYKGIGWDGDRNRDWLDRHLDEPQLSERSRFDSRLSVPPGTQSIVPQSSLSTEPSEQTERPLRAAQPDAQQKGKKPLKIQQQQLEQ